MNICVFCSAFNTDEKYTAPTKLLAKIIGENGHNLVWGGSNVGLMNTIANGVKEAGGKLIGITTEVYKNYSHDNADEMEITKNISERKIRLLARSDMFIILPGGLGTLDEVSEIIELKKAGDHNKPIVVLNTDNFYNGLKLQLERMSQDGFLPKHITLSNIVQFVDTPKEILDIIKSTS